MFSHSFARDIYHSQWTAIVQRRGRWISSMKLVLRALSTDPSFNECGEVVSKQTIVERQWLSWNTHFLWLLFTFGWHLVEISVVNGTAVWITETIEEASYLAIKLIEVCFHSCAIHLQWLQPSYSCMVLEKFYFHFILACEYQVKWPTSTNLSLFYDFGIIQMK